MDYSTDLMNQIEECGKRLMTPNETALYLQIDEIALSDDISTKGKEVRKRYLHGVMTSVYNMREGMLATANAGSPYALTTCKELLLKTLSEANI